MTILMRNLIIGGTSTVIIGGAAAGTVVAVLKDKNKNEINNKEQERKEELAREHELLKDEEKAETLFSQYRNLSVFELEPSLFNKVSNDLIEGRTIVSEIVDTYSKQSKIIDELKQVKYFKDNQYALKNEFERINSGKDKIEDIISLYR